MRDAANTSFWRFFLVLTGVVAAGAVYQTFQQAAVLGVAVWRSSWVFLIGLLAANAIAGLLLGWKSHRVREDAWPLSRTDLLQPAVASALGILLFVGGVATVWWAKLTLLRYVLPQFLPSLWFFLWLSLVQAAGIRLAARCSWPAAFLVSVLLQGIAFQVYGRFGLVSTYPFSIGYSEAGRHYYASLFFSESLYGERVALPFLHPARYMLMSLPYLIQGLPLWAHRAWQGVLWIGLTAAAALLLARRVRLTRGWTAAFCTAWSFLYFLQGAVYYHLQVCVILILAGVSSRHSYRSALVVAAASAWAGISRINWFPVPAMLAAAIYLLEVPVGRRRADYLLSPVLWALTGLLSALAAQAAYASISGHADPQVFGSSLSSPLLWSRLLPNVTFPMGILPGILIITAPLGIATWRAARSSRLAFHPVRWAGLALLLLLSFAGGLIVSVKIGGGADLHNMDSFQVLLALAAVYLLTGSAAAEPERKLTLPQFQWPVLLAAALIPAVIALGYARPTLRYDRSVVRDDLALLQRYVGAAGGGEVLFVSERQLLTFGEIAGVQLVPEYEQMELMEMAMSGNRPYLEQFYADLADRRFAAIIAEQQKVAVRKQGAFPEENAAWVLYVGRALLCAYEPIASLASTNLQVFVPRPARSPCKDPFVE